MLGTLLIGWAAKEVNKDYRDELNRINDDMEEMSDKIDFIVNKVQEKFEKTINDYESFRHEIMDTTLSNFYNIENQMKHIDFGTKEALHKRMNLLDNTMISYKNNSSIITPLKQNLSIALMVVAPNISFISSFCEGISLQGKISEAREEKAQLNVECEKVLLQCEKVNGIISFIELTNGKVKILKLFTDKAIYRLRKIIKNKGYDYALYSEEEKNQTMMVYDFSLTLNDIINTEIFDKNGKVKNSFKKYIGEAEKLCV